jgi:signal transduction histidine kinase
VVIGERDRIAKDLHDGIIQAIYAVVLSLEDVPDFMRSDPGEATDRIERAIERLNLAIRNIRNFIMALSPESSGAPGLVAGLSALSDEIRLNTLMDVELDATALTDAQQSIEGPLALELLQMAREAMSNAARHSRANRIWIRLGVQDGSIQLEVGDDGTGFDRDHVMATGHFGLTNLAERASSRGGSLEIETGEGLGTRILISIPLDATIGTRPPG